MDWSLPQLLKEKLDWPEASAWIESTRPNYQRLIQDFGDCKVSLSDANQEKLCMTFKEAIKCMQEKKYYLKDFHFYKDIKARDQLYKLPRVLKDDFLNEYFDHLGIDDYRFLYLGLDGSFTPMHHDVLKSFSWSVNLTGVKKWTFVSPEQESLLKDKYGNILENIHDYDHDQFKNAKDVVFQELIQVPGKIMFVPSGWYHQVLNIGETLSINHNWINSHNLIIVFQYLDSVFMEIKEMIKEHCDMDGFDDHCQKILKANCGMNIHDFLEMIEISMAKRIGRLTDEDIISLESFQTVLEICSLSPISSSSLSTIKRLKESLHKNL